MQENGSENRFPNQQQANKQTLKKEITFVGIFVSSLSLSLFNIIFPRFRKEEKLGWTSLWTGRSIEFLGFQARDRVSQFFSNHRRTSINPLPLPGNRHSFGEQFSQRKWAREVAGQREILSAYGGVKLEDVRGMRAPFLSVIFYLLEYN